VRGFLTGRRCLIVRIQCFYAVCNTEGNVKNKIKKKKHILEFAVQLFMSVGVTEMLLIVSGSKADDVSENAPFSIFSWKWEMKILSRSVQAGLLQKLVVSHLHTHTHTHTHTDRQTDRRIISLKRCEHLSLRSQNVQNKRCLILHIVAELFVVE
jgi:hypothetical protein